MLKEKTFNAKEAEPRIYRAWENAGAFKAGANASRSETFCVMIPPPNVTGDLHMGHAFNNTLQDILVRWHRMRGFDTLWQPGTDHAGIATQMVVERELAEEGSTSRNELGREKFIERVWQQKTRSRGNIIGQLKRLGASCDWSREAFTMGGAPGDPDADSGAPNFHDAVIQVFVDLYHKDLIYRGKRLVNWDPHFETAISDLEVENVETPGQMWHFRYPLADGETYPYVEKDAEGNIVLEERRDYISIATTRPETMLGDGAVAVHPSDGRYAPIVGKLCEIPLGPKGHRRLIPIIADEYPDPTFGSGAVKITGAHDFNDYAVAKRANIPCYRLMDTRARMRDDGAPYSDAAALALSVAKGERALTEAETDRVNLVPDDLRGLDRYEARAKVIQKITDEGLAVTVPDGNGNSVPMVENKQIMLPMGDRSKTVVEPMLTDQWFVDANRIVGPAIEAVRAGETAILPEADRRVYFHWLENIEPWCISRQLWWGHRIPVWYGFGLSDGSLLHDTGGTAPEPPDREALSRQLSERAPLEGGERRCAAGFDIVTEQFRTALEALSKPLRHARVVEVADRDEAISAIAAGLTDYRTSGDPAKLVYPVWRDPDVLDTWFSSGLWPLGTLGWPGDTDALRKYFPTSVLVTGFDIIFFWVARMMMMQFAVAGRKPFHTVYVHALVRDENGKKMSKSLGNVLDPLDLIDDYGADAVRFTLAAMAAMGRDLRLSTKRIAGYRNFGTKLWNAVRFAEMNGAFDKTAIDFRSNAIPEPTVAAHIGFRPPERHRGDRDTGIDTLSDQESESLGRFFQKLHPADRWIVGETAKAREEIDRALTGFRFNDAANAIHAFVWGKVCDWYVEFSKPLLNSGHAATALRTRAVMGWVMDQCLILLHPIMPFITEELWQATADREKALIHADWPSYNASILVDDVADREMNWVIALIEAIRSARAQMHVPAGLHVPMIQLELDQAGRTAWTNNETLIKRLARIDSMWEADESPKGSITITVEGGTFCLPLSDIIDIAAEKERLERSLSKLQMELAGLKGRLSNKNFLNSAPADVIDNTRQTATLKEEETATLKDALKRMSAIT